MAHTMDLVDLAWTTRQDSTDSAEPEATIRFRVNSVTATAPTDRATDVLAQHGFTPAETAQEYTLPAQRSEALAQHTPTAKVSTPTTPAAAPAAPRSAARRR